MRASRGECRVRSTGGVLLALWMAQLPFVKLTPGEGTCWYTSCGCGDDVICWLRPDGVREGSCLVARLAEGRSDGDPCAECGGGVSWTGESWGESSELMSMFALLLRHVSPYMHATMRPPSRLQMDNTFFRRCRDRYGSKVKRTELRLVGGMGRVLDLISPQRKLGNRGWDEAASWSRSLLGSRNRRRR